MKGPAECYHCDGEIEAPAPEERKDLSAVWERHGGDAETYEILIFCSDECTLEYLKETQT